MVSNDIRLFVVKCQLENIIIRCLTKHSSFHHCTPAAVEFAELIMNARTHRHQNDSLYHRYSKNDNKAKRKEKKCSYNK